MQSLWRQKMSFIIAGVTVFASSLSQSQAYLETELQFRKPVLSEGIKNIKDVHLHLMKDPSTGEQIAASKENLNKLFGINESLVQKKLGENVTWEILADDLKLADESKVGEKASYLFVLSNHLNVSEEDKTDSNFSFKKASHDFLKTTQKVLNAKYLLKLLSLDSSIESNLEKDRGLWAGKQPLQFALSDKVKTIGELKRSIAGGVIAVIKYKPAIKDVESEKEEKELKPADKVSSL